MATVPQTSGETRYGPNGGRVEDLAKRAAQIQWFSSVGKKEGREETEEAVRRFVRAIGGPEEYVLNWMIKDQLEIFLLNMTMSKSPLWEKLEPIPQKMKEKAEQTGRSAILPQVCDEVSAHLYSGLYDAAFREFGNRGNTVIQFAVGAALYIAGLACAWEVLADLDGWGENPFLPLIEVLERGHLPVGLYDGQFYIL